MITLDEIIIEGFRSFIEPVTYCFNRPGIHVIWGKNGSGKTTITTDALSWVLWKKLVKLGKTSFHPWPHIINDKYKGTKVHLKWHDEKGKYEVIRCSEYRGQVLGKTGKDRLIILENGKELFQGVRDKKDHEKWIVAKIGYSFDLFKSTVLFAQELDRLMQEDGPSKKQIFDEAFESTFIQRARSIAEGKFKDQAIEIEKMEHDLSEAKIKYQALKQQIKQANRVVEDFEMKRAERINQVLESINDINSEITELQGKLKGLPELEAKAVLLKKKLRTAIKRIDPEISNQEFKLSLEINAQQDKIHVNTREYEQAKENYIKPKATCENCGQALPKDEVKIYKRTWEKKAQEFLISGNKLKEELEFLKIRYQKILEELENQKAYQKSLSKIQNRIKINDRALEELRPTKQAIQNKKDWIQDKENDLKKIRKEKPPELDLTNLRSRKDRLKAKVDSAKQELKAWRKKQRVTKWLMDEPLSNSGLKAFIFDSMLGKVNKHLRTYTSLVKFEVRVFVDMTLANKPIVASVTRKGDEVPYEDLSKGQKQLVNVVLAFSLNDVVNESKPINILLLDELFENLDEENLEAVSNIILKKSKNKSIHLITHQTKYAPTNAHYTYVHQNEVGQSYTSKEAQ